MSLMHNYLILIKEMRVNDLIFVEHIFLDIHYITLKNLISCSGLFVLVNHRHLALHSRSFQIFKMLILHIDAF